MIKSARILTKEEVDKFYRSLLDKQKLKKDKSWEAIKVNSEKLIDSYKRMDQRFYDEVSEKKKAVFKYQMDWEKKVCLVCGSKMKLVNYGGGFWGCPNFKDKSKGDHTTFPISFIPRYEYMGNKDAYYYLPNIIKECGLKGVVAAGDLYDFLILGNDFDCLYKKYQGGDIGNNLGSLIATNINSKEFEKKCAEELKGKFPKVITQQGIGYETTDGKHGYCFMDIICSNESEVIIYECKTNNFDKKEKQRLLYIEVMQFLLNKVSDGRELKFEYLVEHEDYVHKH